MAYQVNDGIAALKCRQVIACASVRQAETFLQRLVRVPPRSRNKILAGTID